MKVIETTARSSEWDELRNRILGLIERGQPLVAWRVEHGPIGHKAEDALLAATLALLCADDLDVEHSRTLRRPMAEALPWLLQNVEEPARPEN